MPDDHGIRDLDRSRFSHLDQDDRRLAEVGIDPDADPITIMAEVRRRFELRKAADKRYEEDNRAAEEKRDATP